jgi:multiple sugar transport system permease protein
VKVFSARTAAQAVQPSWGWGVGWQKRWLPFLLTGPVVLLVGIGVFYPVIYVVNLSLHAYSPFYSPTMRFVGAENYVRLIGDSEFWHSLHVSAIWVAGSVIPQFLLGLGLALLLNERFFARGIIRAIVLLPWVVSGVVTGIIWLWLFDGTIGVLNDLLMKAGLILMPIPWSVQPTTSYLMLFVANAWRGSPFFAIMLLAALQSISPEVYEAAMIDGAGRWQRFWYVTLPLILNAVVISTLLRAIWTFNYVDLIWTMTQGGPVNASRTLALDIFKVAYQDGDFGFAATLAVALCVILLAFSGVYWQLNRFSNKS